MDPEKPVGLEQSQSLRIEKITSADIKPESLEPGETSIVLQCNAKDDRRPEAPDQGALIPEEATAERQIAYDYFKKLFESLPPEERSSVDILVVASDAVLTTETGIKNKHKRAVESGEQVIAGLIQIMSELSVSQQQLLNTASSPDGIPRPIEISDLKDLKMMDDSPEFVQFLIERYGTGRAFWTAYEEDTEKETRETMGVEGPLDIADRVAKITTLSALAAAEHHSTHPGRRLIFWEIGHYDNLSPFLKKYIAMMDDKTLLDSYLAVDKKGGITIKLAADGKATTDLQGQKIDLSAAV